MERLRDAIAKARATRQEGLAQGLAQGPAQAQPVRRGPVRPPHPGYDQTDAWSTIPRLQLDDTRLANERIVSWKKSDPAYLAFDVLRTRLLRLLAENGWRTVLITSPTKGCGKTTVAINLALSLARQAAARTLLIDLDLKTPSVARRLGLNAAPLADWLRSEAPARDHLARIGDNLAVCLNSKPAGNSAELLHDPHTLERLSGMVAEVAPVAVIYDTPPILASDDALGLLPQVDCVMLVAAAGQTTAEQIEDCERLIEGHTNFLGVLLNKCEMSANNGYRYYENYDDPGQD
jgi:protein-tyrosine kinase